jgi:hypothetical protein
MMLQHAPAKLVAQTDVVPLFIRCGDNVLIFLPKCFSSSGAKHAGYFLR